MKLNKQKLLTAVLAVIVVAGLIAAYFWYQSVNYVSTIDARVSAEMANVVSLTSGKLVTFNGVAGQQVARDEKLGTVDGGAAVSSLNAPISGTIVKINVNEGQTVTSGQTAAVVANMESLYISANIEETEIAKCAVGQGVEIKLDACPGKVLYGKVSVIGNATSSMFAAMSTQNSNGNYTKITQRIPIEIELVRGYPQNLKVGLNAEIKIHVKKNSKAMETAFAKDLNDGSLIPSNDPGDRHILTGILAPVESYSITASVTGRVTDVLVKNGTEVKQGTVLVKQDPTDIQNQTGQGGTSEALLQRLKEAYDLAEETYQNNKKLHESGAISESAFRQAETQRNTALLQYQGTAKLVKEQTAKTTILSPGQGVVTDLNLKPGDSLNAGSPVAAVVDLSSLVMTANVPEDWVGTLSEGNKVSVTIKSLGKTLKGTIRYISPVASSSGQLFPVEVKIDNAEGELKAGMACSADFN